MYSIKTFTVFGDRVDVFVDSAISSGLSSTLVQHVQPGGGPPPHSHTNEDETFAALDGEFEILMIAQWHPLVPGETAYARRGSTHTFPNSGKTIGRIMVIVTPGGLRTTSRSLAATPRSPTCQRSSRSLIVMASRSISSVDCEAARWETSDTENKR